MKKSAWAALLTSLALIICLPSAEAVIAKGRVEANPAFNKEADFKNSAAKKELKRSGKESWTARVFKKKAGQKSGWFASLLKAPAIWLKKITGERDQFLARKYLIICGILLVLTIIFFAMTPLSAVFNFLGSGAVIAAAVFFVLWLKAYTGK